MFTHKIPLPQEFFNDLNTELGIGLENIVYYKDETHYFVMSPKKHSLLRKGVLKKVNHENTNGVREINYSHVLNPVPEWGEREINYL